MTFDRAPIKISLVDRATNSAIGLKLGNDLVGLVSCPIGHKARAMGLEPVFVHGCVTMSCALLSMAEEHNMQYFA